MMLWSYDDTLEVLIKPMLSERNQKHPSSHTRNGIAYLGAQALHNLIQMPTD